MVVLAIVGVLAVMVIVNQNTFNKVFIFTNTVYDIGLTIRSAENYGLSSRALNALTFNTSYGIHFDDQHATSFILFADTTGGSVCPTPALNCSSGDGVYTEGQDVVMETYKIGNGIQITDFCGGVVGNVKCKSSEQDSKRLTALDMVFTRPYSQTVTKAKNAQGSISTESPACVAFRAQSGDLQYLTINASGLIKVKAPSCP